MPADDGLVPTTTRSLSQLADLRAALVRRVVLATALIAAPLVALLLAAAPAGAIVETVPGPTSRVGLQPREVSHYFEGTRKWTGLGTNVAEGNPSATSFDNLQGNPVLHSVGTYVIYWDPQHFYHGDWQHTIDQFMEHMGTAGGEIGNVFAVDAQYTDTTDQPSADHFTFRGGSVDTNPYPEPSGCTDPRPFEPSPPLSEQTAPLVQSIAVCLTNTQLQAQLETYIGQHNLQRGMHTIFYLLTPPGVAVCLDSGGATGHCSEFDGTIKEVEKAEAEHNEPVGYKSYKNSFCSYHNAVGSGEATMLYAVIPWVAGGEGDGQLTLADRVPGYDCQDGAFEPGKTPTGEREEKEQEKPKTLLEEEEDAKKDAEEKRKEAEAEALHLGGPHEQEPNQLARLEVRTATSTRGWPI